MNRPYYDRKPELIMGPNPFIEVLSDFVQINDWPRLLSINPLDGRDWRAISPASREALFSFRTNHFVADRTVVDPAADLQKILRRSCVMRNPLDHKERRRFHQVSLSESIKEILSFSCLEGGGGCWAGITGTKKTRTILRILEVLVPEQVVVHDRSAAAGWTHLRQLVYLKIDFTSNGSRGGLLLRILYGIDVVLGTDYSDAHRKSNLDVLLVAVCKLLCLHQVMLLVIDEHQQKNYEISPWKIEFILFYLSLMNCGISVILLGNPLAFENLKTFSQVQRRFSMAGPWTFRPADSADTDWWKEDWVPGQREFSLVETCSIPEDVRNELDFNLTGGLPGMTPLLTDAAQENALRRATGSSADLALEDYTAAVASQKFQDQKKIAIAVRGGDHEFSDIPPTEIHMEVGIPKGTSTGPVVVTDKETVAAVKRLVAAHKQKTTAITNKLVNDLKSISDLEPHDLRLLGLSADLAAESKKLMEKIRATGEKSSGRPKVAV